MQRDARTRGHQKDGGPLSKLDGGLPECAGLLGPQTEKASPCRKGGPHDSQGFSRDILEGSPERETAELFLFQELSG